MELLSKTRVINQLLQQADAKRVEYAELLQALRDMVAANVFLIDPEGVVLGQSLAETNEFVIVPRTSPNESVQLPKEFAGRLVREDRTLSNLQEVTPFCAHRNERAASYVSVIPILGNAERIGTLLVTRHDAPLAEDDILLVEYSSTVVGYEMMRTRANRMVQEGRDRSIVQMAVSSLSYSELEAVDHILGELGGREGLLVASRIADRVGITRSVIVNALRKLESAGVVEARSLGMKGTHIKILNEKLLPLLEHLKSK
jgi:transcriptional pleiotropic repressor